MTPISISPETDIYGSEEETLVSISQSGQIDPAEWGSAREYLLRRLDQVRPPLWLYMSIVVDLKLSES